jgi:hypothetical protein
MIALCEGEILANGDLLSHWQISVGFGIYFSNLHINVYHVFDVDFE